MEEVMEEVMDEGVGGGMDGQMKGWGGRCGDSGNDCSFSYFVDLTFLIFLQNLQVGNLS